MPRGNHFASETPESSDIAEFASAHASPEWPDAADMADMVSRATDEDSSSTGTFVRTAAPRTTVEPIDDLAREENLDDEDLQLGASAPLPVLGYRSAQKNLPQLNRDIQVGKYLQIPKGHHAIFASRERKRRIQSVILLLFVVALLAAAAFVLWHFVEAFQL